MNSSVALAGSALRVADAGAKDRVSALDGLRTIAAACVVGMHSGIPYFTGGFIGVDIFFVLSGYLITTVLVAEYERFERVDLLAFYGKRALRLYPLLLIFALVCFPGLAIAYGTMSAFGEVWPTLGYVTNLVRGTGLPTVLGHSWSLSLEVQFYIVWPIVLVPALKLIGKRTTAISMLIGAVVVAAWRWHLFDMDVNWTRVYDWPDVHSDGLMIGCALALTPRAAMLKIARMLPIAVAVIVSFVVSVKWLDAAAYHGGILAVNLAAATVIASVITKPASLLSTILAQPSMAWLGKVSYGVYLWHYPVLFLSPILFPEHTILFTVAVSISISALTYHFVELPAMRYGKAMDNRTLGLLMLAAVTLSIAVVFLT